MEEVQFRDGLAKVLSITIRTSGRERRSIIVVNVPLKIKRNANGSAKLLGQYVNKGQKSATCGRLNCKHVNWEEMEVNSHVGCWEEEVLQLAVGNTLD
ncbi:hypothetical protein E2C01_001150 [Portunus trituberculatus]|uniref:Uncharacterized protein n=1 Tax=Portunus trituberculatus TaxID=210409 RepID=A0A5B7CII8_PORTR|nr:hypothetical protein [Portunus trituberculatus]